MKTEEIFISGKGIVGGKRTEVANMVFYSLADERELPGTLIVVKIGGTDHALSIFFRDKNEVKVVPAGHKIKFYFPTFLKKSSPDLVVNLEEIHRLSPENTRHRFMYDFQTRVLQIGSGYGNLGALALPYEDTKFNGKEISPEAEIAKQDVLRHQGEYEERIEKDIKEAIVARNGKLAKELALKLERKLTQAEIYCLAGLEE